MYVTTCGTSIKEVSPIFWAKKSLNMIISEVVFFDLILTRLIVVYITNNISTTKNSYGCLDTRLKSSQQAEFKYTTNGKRVKNHFLHISTQPVILTESASMVHIADSKLLLQIFWDVPLLLGADIQEHRNCFG
jgi:hypothetical protein